MQLLDATDVSDLHACLLNFVKELLTATDSYFTYDPSSDESDTVYTVDFFGWTPDDVVEEVT